MIILHAIINMFINRKQLGEFCAESDIAVKTVVRFVCRPITEFVIFTVADSDICDGDSRSELGCDSE